MTTIPTEPTHAHLLRILARDYPAKAHAQILDWLDEFGVEDWHREHERVRLAILKLGEGELDTLRHYLEVAKRDHRDVLAWAEFPDAMKLGAPGPEGPNSQTRAAAARRDREAYAAWFWRS